MFFNATLVGVRGHGRESVRQQVVASVSGTNTDDLTLLAERRNFLRQQKLNDGTMAGGNFRVLMSFIGHLLWLSKITHKHRIELGH